ncbi:MAG: hypothetical protein ABI721_04360 [Candidatus Dojkabacteria bacterium]
MTRKELHTLAYSFYVLILVFIIAGLYIGYVPIDLGNNLLHLQEGNLISFNPEFVRRTQEISAVYVLFSTVISALGALVSIGTRNIFEILALFLVGMLPKEHNHWGVVFDQKTNQPISFVPIRLFQTNGNKKEFLTQTVTDTDGRYRLHVNEANVNERYLIEIYYPGYETISQDVNQYLILGNYDLIHDIPLVKSDSVTNKLKSLFYYYRPKILKYLFLIIYYSYILLWIFNIFLLINSPIFLNFFSVCVLTITLVWNVKILRSKLRPITGKIIDAEGKKPLSKAIVKIYTNKNQSISTVTDESGIVNLDIPSGVYKMLVSAEGYLMLSEDPVGLKLVKVSKDGFIDEDVLLKKDTSKATSSKKDGSELLNPFE